MLKKESTGLIVVDIQGQLTRLVHDSDALVSKCEKLIKGIQALELPILWLKQNPEKIGPTVEELSTLLSSPTSHQEPIIKYTFDGCENDQFIDAVKATNVDTWIVCGIEAHICD